MPKLPHETKPIIKCIFCGSPGPLTGEHVFSQWTHKFLPPRARAYSKLDTLAHLDRTQFKVHSSGGDTRDWKVRCVCGPNCNNGWMRKLIDDPAREVMSSLIEGQNSRITEHQQKIIANWAALKAIVAEYDRISNVSTHHMQRKMLMNKQEVSTRGWAIWMGHYNSVAWKTVWSAVPFLVSERQAVGIETKAATHYNSHATTQVIGQMLIHILRCPDHQFVTSWKFKTPDGGQLFRIWPPTGISFLWPGRTLTDRDASYISGAVKAVFDQIIARRMGVPVPPDLF